MKTSDVLLCVIVIVSFPCAGFAQGEVKVDGFVHNTDGKAVAGVKVSLFAPGKKDPIDSVRTDLNGYYKLNRKIESTYDIWFSHSQMDLAIVELLAENKDQQISLKVYKRGEKRPASAYHESLQSAERLLFTIVSLPPADRGALFGEYKESGAMDMIYAKAIPLSTMPSEPIIRFINEKRELLKKLDRDAGSK